VEIMAQIKIKTPLNIHINCPDCDGEGYVDTHVCTKCKGTGIVVKPQKERKFKRTLL
jgi:DnaJ-class molecular chaperone